MEPLLVVCWVWVLATPLLEHTVHMNEKLKSL
jgi:hypothetical protein